MYSLNINFAKMFNTWDQSWIWMATEKPHLQFCNDILNELIDDIVDRYAEADKLYVRDLPTNNNAEGPSNRKKVSTQPLLPKLQKLGFRVQEKAQRIDFGEADPRPLRHNHKQHFVGQVESWEQVQNDSCGYFALQNATNLVMGAMIEDQAESERYLKNILSPSSFWINHSKYKQRLLKIAKTKQSDSDYHWTPKHINLGILERSFAQELLYGDIVHPLRNNASLLPEFGLGFLCHNGFQRRTMAAMREIFDKFQKRSHYIHAFIIGQTNHWITVVVNKIGDKTETFLIDSRNRFALDFSKDEIFNFVETHLKHRPPYIRELVQLSMRDNQFSADFLASCARGLTDIYSYLLNLTLSHFLYGCYAALNDVPRETDEFNLDALKMEFDVNVAQKNLVTWHDRLSTWLSVYFPTPVIETNIIACIHNAGLDSLSPYLHGKFKEWTIYMRKNLDKIKKDHKKLKLEWVGDVRRLSKILVWFEATFV